MKRVGIGCLVAVLLFFVLMGGGYYVFEFPGYLLLGWIAFLANALGRVRVNPVAVVTFALCLGAFGTGVHLFGRWLYGEWTARRGERKPWPRRWTLAIAALVVLLFTAGIACIGLMHQSAWLATSGEPWVVSNWGRRDRANFAAYTLMEQAEEKKMSTEQLKAAARELTARFGGEIQYLIATDRNGAWAAVLEVSTTPRGDRPAGRVIGVHSRDEVKYKPPSGDLEAILAYFAQFPEEKPQESP